jgi:hypothetical protein
MVGPRVSKVVPVDERVELSGIQRVEGYASAQVLRGVAQIVRWEKTNTEHTETRRHREEGEGE